MLNDAISKAEVLETYAELYDVFEDNKGIQKELHKVYDKLNALPSAQKKGKWTERIVIEDRKAIEEWQSARCSVCGKYHTTPYMYYFDYFAYCPNCGALMEEGND